MTDIHTISKDYFYKVKSASLKDLMHLWSDKSKKTIDSQDIHYSKDTFSELSTFKDTTKQILDIKDTAVLVNALKQFLNQKNTSDRQLLDLFISSESIVNEIQNQHQGMTLFKGPFFDLLRHILHKYKNNEAVKDAMTKLLSTYLDRFNPSYLIKVKSSINDLSQILSQTKDKVSIKQLDTLFSLLHHKEQDNIQYEAAAIIKSILLKYPDHIEVQRRLRDITDLIIKLSHQNKILSFNDDIDHLLNQLNESEGNLEGLKNKMMESLKFHFANQQNRNREGIKQNAVALEKILTFVGKNMDTSHDSNKQIGEQLIKSMMAGQDYKSPILHFFLPVKYEDTKAFGELWVKQDKKNSRKAQQNKNGIRVLLAMDIMDVGRFEADLYLQGDRIKTKVYCPPPLVERFTHMDKVIRRVSREVGLKADEIEVTALNHTRTLNEVFEEPIERRFGINAKA